MTTATAEKPTCQYNEVNGYVRTGCGQYEFADVTKDYNYCPDCGTEGGEGMTGAEIMKHRRKMNYTTDKLAQKVGVTVDTVQKWERDIMKA